MSGLGCKVYGFKGLGGLVLRVKRVEGLKGLGGFKASKVQGLGLYGGLWVKG